MSYYAFSAIMLICIYLAILATDMKSGASLYIKACSISVFVFLLIWVTIL